MAATAWVLLLAAAGAAAAHSDPPVCPQVDWATCSMHTPSGTLGRCLDTLLQRNNSALKQLSHESGQNMYSNGNVYQCSHPTGFNASRDAPTRTCFVEFAWTLPKPHAPGQHMVIQGSRGLCMPSVCSGADVTELLYALGHCGNTSTEYLDRCVTPRVEAECHQLNGTEHQDDCIKAWDAALRDAGVVLAIASTISDIHTQCGPVEEGALSPGAVIMILVMVGLVLLAVLAYAYEFADRQAAGSEETKTLLDGNLQAPISASRGGQSRFRAFVSVFSVNRNIDELIAKEPSRSIATLDAMRVISMLWIILAHTGDFMLPPKNYYDNEPVLAIDARKVSWDFLAGGNSAVDTFFFISGLLTAYSLLRRAAKGAGRILVFKFTLLRYLRLLPLVAICVGFYATLVVYTADSIMWVKMYEAVASCRDYWWSNLLFINNFYPSEYDLQCLPWAWYLAVDMQLFIVTLFLLILYLYNRKLGVAVTVFLTVTGTAITWAIVEWKKITLDHHLNIQQDEIYVKPYTRMPTYMIGVLAGFLLTDVKRQRLQISPLLAHVLLVISSAMLLFLGYLFYLDGQHPFDVHASAAYYALGRLGWSIFVGIIVILCSTGQGTVFTEFLSLRIWEPLGKLTFGAYLTHPIIIRMRYHSSDVTEYHTTMLFAFNYCAFVLLAYVTATVLYVLVESPSQAFIGFLSGRSKKPTLK